MPTNQEFTTCQKDDHTRHNDTLFYINLIEGHDGQIVRSKSGHFRLVHGPTRVSLWTHPKQLPDWAFKQQEVNGNKAASEQSATWFVDDIIAGGTFSGLAYVDLATYPLAVEEDFKNRTAKAEPKKPKHMNFLRKFGELQLLMMQHNAGLTASHPYASSPINWPFLLSGISFWTESDPQKQIYFIGNIVGWWTCVVSLSIYVGILGADQLARRRGLDPIPDRKLSFVADRQIFTLHSRQKPPVELRRILHTCLGRALCPFLPYEPPVIHPPLSSFTPCICHDRWRGSEFYSVGDSQLPCISMGTHCPQPPEAVCRSWNQGANNLCLLLCPYVRGPGVFRAVDVRHARVHLLCLQCPPKLLTLCAD